MTTTVRATDVLIADHHALGALLQRLRASGDTPDPALYDEFRAALLHHIAMEEKVLFPAARGCRDGERLALEDLIRTDHAALAGLMALPADGETIGHLWSILLAHNPLEEGPGGIYAECESALGSAAADVATRLAAVPPVKVSPVYDGDRVRANVAALLEKRVAAHRAWAEARAYHGEI